MRLKKFVEGEGKGYQVRMAKPEKYRKLNPKTNRMKNFKRQRFMSTDIKPSERTFKNQPRYADGKPKVTFQQWLEIKTEPDLRIGKGADGKWYGWSHRAVYGFKTGDKITGDNLGKKVKYPKYTKADLEAEQAAAKPGENKAMTFHVIGQENFDNPQYEPDFIIKNDAHAREVAARFADNVS